MAQQMKLDMSPFSDADLFKLGSSTQHWSILKKVLQPITAPDFAVNDPVRLAMVDDARHRLDAAYGGWSTQRNALQTIVAGSQEDGDHEVLKLLLMAGVHPDLPDHDGCHPSHHAASYGRYKLAKAIFRCRPNMNALSKYGDTPIALASRRDNLIDYFYPASTPMRMDIATFLKSSGYENGFPMLADLAVRRKWYAVKNLVRRQVVPLSEYVAKSHGKTVEEWAVFHKCEEMADELRYFASLPTCKLIDAEMKVKDLETELSAVKHELIASKEETAAKDERITQLAEMLVALSEPERKSASESHLGEREGFRASLWEMGVDKLIREDQKSEEAHSKDCSSDVKSSNIEHDDFKDGKVQMEPDHEEHATGSETSHGLTGAPISGDSCSNLIETKVAAKDAAIDRKLCSEPSSHQEDLDPKPAAADEADSSCFPSIDFLSS